MAHFLRAFFSTLQVDNLLQVCNSSGSSASFRNHKYTACIGSDGWLGWLNKAGSFTQERACACHGCTWGEESGYSHIDMGNDFAQEGSCCCN